MTARKTTPRKSTLNAETTRQVTVDLDAIRKANGYGKIGKSFTIDGETFDVPERMTFFTQMKIEGSNSIAELEDGLRLWLGDEQYERFSKTSIDDDEFQQLLTSLYGAADQGEPEPSDS